jgi:hypothetical protein
VGSDGQGTDHFKRRNYTATCAGPRRTRNAAGDNSRPGRTRRPLHHRILYLDHPQPQHPDGVRACGKRFFDWCDKHHVGLEDIEPIAIAAYIEELGAEIAKPSVKQHLAAIRQLFDYLVTGGVLVSTPAGSVRGPKFVVTRGKTPVLSGAAMRQLLKSIDVGELIGLRDHALFGLMGYTFAGITAYLQNGGTVDHAQQIAAHQSPRTTKLYDRRKDEISIDEVEAIKF